MDFLTTSCEHLMTVDPNCKIILAGDVNQLKYKDLLVHASLSQMVKKATRGENILDVFITNTPYLWEKVKVFESAIRSDHSMVIACPRSSAKAKRSSIQFRDVREGRKIHMAYLLESQDWQEVFSVADCELKCDGLSNTLCTMFNECFPLISVRISSRDPPFISPLVKHLLKFRNRLQKRSKPLPIGLEDRSTILLGKINDKLLCIIVKCIIAICINNMHNWKMADIRPLPKESPFTCCTQLRPISLTAVIMILFERLVYRFELSSICNDYINLDQFANRGGHNSTMALLNVNIHG